MRRREFRYLGFLLAAVLCPAAPAPTAANVRYGPHDRNVLDFWQAPAPGPAPLAIYIHGGGFRSGSKERISARALERLLAGGISVAAINYRFVPQHPLPAAHHDARRALQFLRSRAREWNIDPRRIAAFGSSAGAQLAMYLAFHDDMARPASPDPVERHSTRLAAVATSGGQTTMDLEWWRRHIPGAAKFNRRLDTYFGAATPAEIRAMVADISALSLVSRDDPPIYMSYAMAPGSPLPAGPAAAVQSWILHHVAFGQALEARMRALGLEVHLRYPGARTAYASVEDFLLDKLRTSPEPAL